LRASHSPPRTRVNHLRRARAARKAEHVTTRDVDLLGNRYDDMSLRQRFSGVATTVARFSGGYPVGRRSTHRE
jgi:hypothetical protein